MINSLIVSIGETFRFRLSCYSTIFRDSLHTVSENWSNFLMLSVGLRPNPKYIGLMLPISRIFVYIALLTTSAGFCEHRIVSTSPQATELMFQLGLGLQIVATVEYSDYPKAAKQLPRIGTMFAPSIEKTLKQTPTHVVLDRLNLNPHFAQALSALGIATVQLDLQTIEQIQLSAERLVATFASDGPNVLEKFSSCLKLKPSGTPFTYLALVWTEPAMIVGRATFLSTLFERLGATNLAPDLAIPYPTVSDDWLLSQKPSVVFLLLHNPLAMETFAAKLRDWFHHPFEMVHLEPDLFSRSNLTPILSVQKLKPFSSVVLPGDCLDFFLPHS